MFKQYYISIIPLGIVQVNRAYEITMNTALVDPGTEWVLAALSRYGRRVSG